MSILHKLQWCYNTEKFNPQKIVSEEDITELLKAMNLSASSFGLQPYQFIVIHNKKLQAELRKISHDQAKLTEASHIMIIAAKTKLDLSFIDRYIQNITSVREYDLEALSEFKERVLQINSKDQREQQRWAEQQCYITLGTLLIAAADLKIDTCVIEEYLPEAYDKILELDTKGLHTTVVVAIGYRSHEDTLQHAKKSRRNLDDIVDLYYGK